jgi:hypothetical protein
VIDLVKRQNKQKGKKEDEVARNDNLTPEARTVLRGLARSFLESCFNRTQHIYFFPASFVIYHFLISFALTAWPAVQPSSRRYSRTSNPSAQKLRRRTTSACCS